ncbi:DUF3515 family protein [Subtercola frigoramans]|uniref:DUF3515 domain-containing protein n=1 Tax=Subtercola frigoramans TaxID=120298 RepID=A0ABS2L8C5_9MICO|nr:DUF3515 family protein [Subtercola frigoramans]MBM7472970.1 hypothetical protein [Subtercola frigoramans]
MLARKRLLLPGALVAGLLAVALTGCTPTVALDPATAATDPGCAEIMVRLPSSVASQDSRETNAQATAAWGSPASVLLRCGVTPYGPTTLPCDNVSGIDWIEDDSKAPSYTFTTFGRVPATEVIIDSNAVSASTALVDLQSAIAAVAQTNKCLNATDLQGIAPTTGSNPTAPATTGTPAPFTLDTPAPTPAG